jgi:hypothetical protein
MKRNNGRFHNSTGTTTEVTRNPELLIEDFQSIFSFCAVGLYLGENSKVEYTYGWYSVSAGIK